MHRRLSLSFFAVLSAAALSACGGNSSTPPTFVVRGLGTPSSGGTIDLAAATTYTLTATETASGGGSVTPGALTITFVSATGSGSIGTATGDTIVTGTGNASGTIKVVDSKTGLGETFTVVVLSTHPATTGDTLTLAGTLTHTIARPLPAPSAIAAPVTTTVAVSDVVKIDSTDATFNDTTSLIDENVVETDTAPLQTITTTSDTYTHFVASGATQQYAAVGSKSFDSNGVHDGTIYGTGNGLIDELPDTSGATFANTGAETFAEAEPDSTTVARTVNADGSYTETDTYPGDNVGTTQTNSDLSASIVNLGGLPINVTYGAPTGTGSAATIAVSVVVTGQNAQTLAAGTIPSWLPTATILSDTFVKGTAQTIPTACAVPSSVGTTATEVVETLAHVDTALGTYEKKTAKVFNVPGFGSVCVQLADEIDAYYDYTGQEQGLVPGLNLAVSSTPIQIDTLAETIGYTTGTVASSSSSRRAAQASSSTATLRAVEPMFDRAVQSIYRARRDATMRNLAARRAAFVKEHAR